MAIISHAIGYNINKPAIGLYLNYNSDNCGSSNAGDLVIVVKIIMPHQRLWLIPATLIWTNLHALVCVHYLFCTENLSTLKNIYNKKIAIILLLYKFIGF